MKNAVFLVFMVMKTVALLLIMVYIVYNIEDRKGVAFSPIMERTFI